MSDGIINFRKAKKRVKAAKKDARAQENRVKFGRTKAEKERDAKDRDKTIRHLDGHRRSDPD